MATNESQKDAPIQQTDLQKILDTLGEMQKTIDAQNEVINSQRSELDKLSIVNDPRRRKKRETVKIIKDEERTAKFFMIDMELTKNGECTYFEEDRKRLEKEPKFRRELLIMSIDRTFNLNKGKDENYLFGEFRCIDVDKTEYIIKVPFMALNDNRRTIKGVLYKHHTNPIDKVVKTVTKYVKDEDGNIVDEYDIDLRITGVEKHYDVEIISDCAFKGMKFENVPEKNINIF